MTTTKEGNTGQGEIAVQIVISDELAQFRESADADLRIDEITDKQPFADRLFHLFLLAASRQFTDPDLEQAEQENYRKVSEGLGLAVPKQG